MNEESGRPRKLSFELSSGVRKAQLYSSLSEVKGENNEPGSRENCVNRFTCDQILPDGQGNLSFI